MEHGTPVATSQNDWQIFDSVLLEKCIPRQVMIYPERYMEQQDIAKRRAAIKEMNRRGMDLEKLANLTPFCRRYLRDIISSTNGNEPELPGIPPAAE